MARQETLTAWILRNDERLDLRVQELSWIKSAFPGWHDLQVSISAFGERFTGRGSDPIADTALGKAVCEAVERATCFCQGISSLGVAGHLSLELAEENARLEYIERFCFSRQIEGGFTLAPLPPPATIWERYAQHGGKIGLFRVASPDETPVVLCLASGGTSFGGIVGLGAAPDLESAKPKAVMECLRSLEFYLHTKPASLSHADFQKLENPEAKDRQALLRDGDYFRKLLARLTQSPSDFKIPEGRFDQLALDSVFVGCPLVFTRYSTSTPLVQPEFLA